MLSIIYTKTYNIHTLKYTYSYIYIYIYSCISQRVLFVFAWRCLVGALLLAAAAAAAAAALPGCMPIAVAFAVPGPAAPVVSAAPPSLLLLLLLLLLLPYCCCSINCICSIICCHLPLIIIPIIISMHACVHA